MARYYTKGCQEPAVRYGAHGRVIQLLIQARTSLFAVAPAPIHSETTIGKRVHQSSHVLPHHITKSSINTRTRPESSLMQNGYVPAKSQIKSSSFMSVMVPLIRSANHWRWCSTRILVPPHHRRTMRRQERMVPIRDRLQCLG